MNITEPITYDLSIGMYRIGLLSRGSLSERDDKIGNIAVNEDRSDSKIWWKTNEILDRTGWTRSMTLISEVAKQMHVDLGMLCYAIDYKQREAGSFRNSISVWKRDWDTTILRKVVKLCWEKMKRSSKIRERDDYNLSHVA